MAFQPKPLAQTEGTANAYFAAKPVDLSGLPEPTPELPEIPETGTFVLTATDGVLSWEVSA